MRNRHCKNDAVENAGFALFRRYSPTKRRRRRLRRRKERKKSGRKRRKERKKKREWKWRKKRN